MVYYEELCTLNEQLKQTSSMSMKELTFFFWTLTRREESERKKARLAYFRHDGEFLTVCPAKSIVFCLPCLPSLFHAKTMKAFLNSMQEEKNKKKYISFYLY